MRGKGLWAILVIVPALIGGLMTAAVLLTPLPEPDNPEVTEILDASGKIVARLYTEDRIEIPISRMPKDLFNAIVAIEDDRFYHHRGIDPVGIGRALIRNVRAGKVVEGGSTLTQQLARNLSFGGARLGQKRTIARKIREALITIKIEYKYSKEQILGLYWNSIYLGRGAYGLERAAQTYFRKSVQNVPDGQPLNLTLAESAVLASLPQAPEYYPSDNSEAQQALLGRRNLVLDRMAEQGYATRAAVEEAKSEPLALKPATRTAEGSPYFADYVSRELKERYPEVAENLHRGGYRIITTLDSDVQGAANSAVEAGLRAIKEQEATKNEEPEVALVAIDPATGYIRALVGGRRNEVEVNRALEPRQPGSTFKPFVYATALSTRKYVVTSTKLDTPREFPGRVAGETWRIRNWEGKSSNKPETMRTALKLSLNTVTAAWMDDLKPEPVIKTAKSVGLDAEYPRNLTIGLGTVSVSPLQVTSAFAALANGGYRVKPMAVLRVEDRAGNVYVSQEPTRVSAIEPGVAFIVTDMLKEVLRDGGTAWTAGRAINGRPAAGKSGSTDNSVDAWFVGYTPDLVAGVWTGYDDRRQTALLGGRDPSGIWSRFMNQALAERPFRDWTPPTGVMRQEICTLTGLRPNASCPAGQEWFLKGTAPTEIDSTIHWGQVVPQLPGVPWALPGMLPPTTPSGKAPPSGEWPSPSGEAGGSTAPPSGEAPPEAPPQVPPSKPSGSPLPAPERTEPAVRAPGAPPDPATESKGDQDEGEHSGEPDPEEALQLYPGRP